MPEGHTIRRLADALGESFAGRRVRASSPQGRFADGAQVIDAAVMGAADAAGKHLFCDFDNGAVLHVHLGLIGRLDLHQAVAQLPAPLGQVRLRLWADEGQSGVTYADLRGATVCEVIGEDRRTAIIATLGPDPLRPDADPTRAWQRVRASTRAIGDLLLDQRVVAGVGNIYRTEVLFRAGVHPLRPGCRVRRAVFVAMWHDLVALMADGVRTGRIDTVRPEHEPAAMGRRPRVDAHGGEVYVYRREGLPCLVCQTPVRRAAHAGRSIHWCPRCQRHRVASPGDSR